MFFFFKFFWLLLLLLFIVSNLFIFFQMRKCEASGKLEAKHWKCLIATVYREFHEFPEHRTHTVQLNILFRFG